MKRIKILVVGSVLTLAAAGCSTCPNPYDYSSPVQSGGYAQPAPMYSAPTGYGAAPAGYGAAPAGYNVAPAGYNGAAPQANNGYVGQPTPANAGSARLTPVEAASGTTTR